MSGVTVYEYGSQTTNASIYHVGRQFQNIHPIHNDFRLPCSHTYINGEFGINANNKPSQNKTKYKQAMKRKKITTVTKTMKTEKKNGNRKADCRHCMKKKTNDGIQDI